MPVSDIKGSVGSNIRHDRKDEVEMKNDCVMDQTIDKGGINAALLIIDMYAYCNHTAPSRTQWYKNR